MGKRNMKPTSTQKTAIQKLFENGVERAATMLNYLTETSVSLQLSPLQLMSQEQLQIYLHQRIGENQVSAVRLVIKGELSAIGTLLFPAEASEKLVQVIATEQRRKLDLDAVTKQTLNEVGNIFFNGVMGSISYAIRGGITYMAPRYVEGKVDSLVAKSRAAKPSPILFWQTAVKIEPKSGNLLSFLEKIRGGGSKEILFFFQIEPLEVFINAIEKVYNN